MFTPRSGGQRTAAARRSSTALTRGTAGPPAVPRAAAPAHVTELDALLAADSPTVQQLEDWLGAAYDLRRSGAGIDSRSRRRNGQEAEAPKKGEET